jgi:predicted transposase/invertase (TIGR01784 family)
MESEKSNDDEVIIKPTTDLFIASLWSNPKHEPALRSLLNSVMTDIGMPPVKKATVLNPFNIQEFAADKQIRLDVLVEDESRAQYNIEVQTASHPGFLHRILYYWAECYTSQLHRGGDYRRLRPVRSIVITEFPVFPALEKIHAVFDIASRENPAVMLSENFQAHFLRLGNLLQRKMSGLEELTNDLRKWFEFWAFGLESGEEKMSALLEGTAVAPVYDEYLRFSADPAMREKVRMRERFLTEQRLLVADSRAEGEAKGKAEKAAEVAKQMKADGMPTAAIAKYTGLSAGEIEGL